MIRVRSGYSFREAAGSIDDVLSRLVEIGAQEAPITDRASTFGFYRWDKAARKVGLRPIFGVELAVTRAIHEKKPAFDFVTFVAKDSVAPLNRLVELATQQFRYRPLLRADQAFGATGVYRILGHRTWLPDLIEAPPADTFLALGPSTPTGLARLAVERGFPMIATSDNRYPREGDRGFYEVLTGRNAETQTYPQHILSSSEWARSIRRLDLSQDEVVDALRTAENVRAGSTAVLTGAKLLAPTRPATLREMCIRGAEEIGCDLSRPDYAARLDRELGLIADKAFEDYFYIVADLCQFARSRMIVGPARGSSCGSLVCYLLRITTVDPIPFGLIFERFIDVNRNDLPDIDIDFSDQHRYMVFDYLREKYGPERVARLGTVAMFKPRSALQECGAALRVPRFKTEAVAESLVVRSSADARALDTLEDTLTGMPAGRTLLADHPEMIVATRFEGHPRHYSQHAAGVVIAERPVIEIVAIDRRTGATMCDKKDAEDGYGLLKIDALGLTQLSVFERTLKLMGVSTGDALSYLEKLPLDDPAAFAILNDQKWSGIFQFNGTALQGITKQFVVDKFDDIVTITALGRPGPMASGGAQEWIYRRIGEKPVEYPHPMFEAYLGDTLGIVVYQEQVMEIGRNIGDLTWEDVTALRKAMSKSLGKEFFDKFGDPWKRGAIAKGLDPKKADKIWDDLCLSGDTILENPFPSKGSYRYMTLKDLYNRGGLGPGIGGRRASGEGAKRQSLLMWDGESLKPAENWGVTYSGRKMTFTLTTDSGNQIHATEDHRLLMPDGSYKRLRDLTPGEFVMSDAGTIPTERKMKKGTGSGGHNWWHKLQEGKPNYSANREYLKKMFKRCQHCKEAPYEETHHINRDHEDHRIENLLPVCRKCHKKLHAIHNGSYHKPWEKGRAIFADEIVSIEERYVEDVYDIHMPDPHHNFLANSIVVHNCAYGSWSFNKSHSVAYGLVSYWCCWLKAHFPFEFAAATLSFEPDPDKQIKMLREMRDEGIDYAPVDPAISTELWEVGTKDGKRALVGPLSGVKGIGPKMIRDILDRRGRSERLTDRQVKLLSDPKTAIDSLWPIRDAFARVMPDPLDRNIVTPPTPIREIVLRSTDYEAMVFCVLRKINPRDENEAVKVARRGGREITDGPTTSLELYVADDTDTIFAKIGRFDYERFGKAIVERGKGLRSLYAVKGRIRADAGFRMMNVKAVRYIGDVGEDVAVTEASGGETTS